MHLLSGKKNSLHSYFSLDKKIARVLFKLVWDLGYLFTVEQCKVLSGSIAIVGSVIFKEGHVHSRSEIRVHRGEELTGEA